MVEELVTIATQQVHDAWVVQGPRPDYHRQAQIKLMRDWPRLAAALDSLAQAMEIDAREAAQTAADTEHVMNAIGSARVMFWQCPNHTEGHVEWNDNVPRCLTCGATPKGSS